MHLLRTLSVTFNILAVFSTPIWLEKRDDAGFIHRGDDGQLYTQSGQLYRFASFNVPGLLLLEDRPTSAIWVPPTAWEQEDAIASVAKMNGRVIRTYTLGVGPNYHITGLRTYNENLFVIMDQAIALCAKHNVKLIIPFLNNHWKDVEGLFGDFGDFTALRKMDPALFYTNPMLQDDFKHLLSFILNRVNTITGVRYGDDPTILAWETGNELGGVDYPTPTPEWTIMMAKYIKSLAPNTLVIDGRLGSTSARARFYPEVLKSPYIDIFTSHYYWGESDVTRITDDIDFISSFGKGFLIGEFGLQPVPVLDTLLDKALKSKTCGALLWSLRYRSRDGGFYNHVEEDNTRAYHIPGFKNGDFPIIQFMYKYSQLFSGNDPSAPLPDAGTPSPIEGFAVTVQGGIRWRGAIWAASYNIYRASCVGCQQNPGNWKQVAANVDDNVPTGQIIWSDSSFASLKGQSVWYMIESVSVSGKVGSSFVMGPIKYN